MADGVKRDLSDLTLEELAELDWRIAEAQADPGRARSQSAELLRLMCLRSMQLQEEDAST
jgi:hypothetical protein